MNRWGFSVWMVLAAAWSVQPGAGEEVAVDNGVLRACLELPSGRVTVEDRQSRVTWRQYVPVQSAKGVDWGKVTTSRVGADALIRVDEAVAVGRTIQAKATWRGHPFDVLLELAADEPSLSISVDEPDRNKPLPWKPDWAGGMLMTYPYAFYHDEAGHETVVPIDEGVSYSARETDPYVDPRRWKLWWLHQKLSMPWWGSSDGRRGVMTEIETPFDCMFSIQWVNTPDGERTLPQVRWVASKGRLAYARRVKFRFFAEGGPVAMAKTFRRAEAKRGALRSWEEKIADNPAVERLRGALDIWSQPHVTPQLIAHLREAGIRRAIVGKPRAGNAPPGEGTDPEAIQAAVEAGYLIGAYHNHSWIQGRWVDNDPSLEDVAVMGSEGRFNYMANAWDPQGRLDRCPAAHLEIFLAGGRQERSMGINYFFTDCTTTGGSIQECYHPRHPLSRPEGAEQLDEALRRVGRLGLIVGSERGKWWATRSTHVFEGVETLIEYAGRYYGHGDATHWVGPYLTEKPGFKELCLGYDFNPARRLPLFQLVYHDSVYCTRRWNQDPGRDPALWDRHDLMNILYGTAPLIFMHPEAGNVIGSADWMNVKDRYLQTYRNVCGWHEKVAFDELTDHRFLSAGRLVQETRFSSGWNVVVNFGDQPWQDPRGFTVAARSYHAFKQ